MGLAPINRRRDIWVVKAIRSDPMTDGLTVSLAHKYIGPVIALIVGLIVGSISLWLLPRRLLVLAMLLVIVLQALNSL